MKLQDVEQLIKKGKEKENEKLWLYARSLYFQALYGYYVLTSSPKNSNYERNIKRISEILKMIQLIDDKANKEFMKYRTIGLSIKTFATPMNYLKGKFCLEYAQTLRSVGKNTEARRLLDNAKALFKSSEKLSSEEQEDKKKYLNDIDQLLKSYPKEDNFIFKPDEENEQTKILKDSSRIGEVAVNPFSEYELYNTRFDTDEEYFKDDFDYNKIKDLVGKGVWRRPNEFYDVIPEVVRDFLSPSVKQMEMGDCSNIAPVMAITNHMALYGTTYLKNMIYPQNKDGWPIYNPYGKYVIKIYINGCFRSVLVDDYQLTSKECSGVIIAQSLLQTELWVSLLEKAIMKVFYTGSYFSCELSCFTGCATRSYSSKELLNNLDKIWNELYTLYSNGHIISTLSVCDQGKLPIVHHHAYAILAYREYNKEKWILVGNAHGIKGPWYIDNNIWDEKHQKYIGYNRESADCFCSVNASWFLLKDVLPECNGINIAYHEEIYPFNGSHHILLPGLVPRQVYFRHQYTFEVTPTKGVGEVYFEFERHSKDESDSNIYVFNDFLDVTGENCKRLMDEPSSMNRTYYMMKVWGNRQIIDKPSKFVIVSYLKDNNIYPVPMTIRIFSKNMKISHGPLAMERFTYNSKVSFDWITDYNPMEQLFYMLPQLKIVIPQNTKLFIYLKCENERVGGSLFKGENRIYCDGDSKTVSQMAAQFNENVCEIDVEKGEYRFVPYLINNNKPCKIDVRLESPISLEISSTKCEEKFIEYNIKGVVKDGGEYLIQGFYTQLPQYKLTVKEITRLLLKSNDSFSYFIYVFDSKGNSVLSETQCENIASVHSIYSYCANLQPGQYSLVLHCIHKKVMKSYSFSMWSTKPISYDKVDLTRQSLILLKDGKRIRNTFGNIEYHDKPSNDQWCIDILEESCDLVCSCETVDGISEFQLYESNGDHLFSIGERMISGRILGKSNTTSSVTLKKGKYTLVPSFAEKSSSASMGIVFRGSSLFTITQITDWFNLDIHDEWTEANNKGYNHHTVSPQYLITVTKTTPLYLYLNTTCDDQVMLLLYRSDGRYFDYQDNKCSVIDKPNCFSFSSKIIQSNLTPGNYIAECLVYKQATHGPFTLTIQSPDKLTVKRCPELGEGYLHYHYDGKWSKSDGTASGCCNHHHYDDNPIIPITFEEENTELVMVFNPTEKVCVGVDLYKDEQNKSPKEQLKQYPKSIFKINGSYFWAEIPLISEVAIIPKGKYFFVPSTFDPFEGPISIDIYTNKPVNGEMIKEQYPVINSRLLRLDADILYRQSFLYFSNSKLEKVAIKTNGNTKEENEEIELLRKQLYCCLGENMEMNKKLKLMGQDEKLFSRKITNTDTAVIKLKAELIDAQSKIDELNEKLNNKENNVNEDSERKKLSAEIDELKQELSKSKEKEKINEKIILELQTEIEKMKKEKGELPKIGNNATPPPPPVAENDGNSKKYEIELAEKNKKIKEMEKELSELNEKLKILTDDLDKERLLKKQSEEEKQKELKQNYGISIKSKSPQTVTTVINSTPLLFNVFNTDGFTAKIMDKNNSSKARILICTDTSIAYFQPGFCGEKYINISLVGSKMKRLSLTVEVIPKKGEKFTLVFNTKEETNAFEESYRKYFS